MGKTNQMTEAAAIKEKEIRPILKLVAQIVRQHLPETTPRILLFGSWATLKAMPTSDIDIGLLGEAPVDFLVMAQLREEIARLPTLRKIEVVDLWGVEDQFRANVEQQAELLA